MQVRAYRQTVTDHYAPYVQAVHAHNAKVDAWEVQAGLRDETGPSAGSARGEGDA